MLILIIECAHTRTLSRWRGVSFHYEPINLRCLHFTAVRWVSLYVVHHKCSYLKWSNITKKLLCRSYGGKKNGSWSHEINCSIILSCVRAQIKSEYYYHFMRVRWESQKMKYQKVTFMPFEHFSCALLLLIAHQLIKWSQNEEKKKWK